MIPLTLNLNDVSKFHDNYFAGLSWLASQVPRNSFIVECGTYEGNGANTMAAAGPEVFTFDLAPLRRPLATLHPRVRFQQLDCMLIPDDLLHGSSLVFLDIDPHAGPPEVLFYKHLKEIGFRGVLACDDIAMGEGMRAFWDQISEPKFTTAQHMHLTGFGFVAFDPAHTITPLTS